MKRKKKVKTGSIKISNKISSKNLDQNTFPRCLLREFVRNLILKRWEVLFGVVQFVYLTPGVSTHSLRGSFCWLNNMTYVKKEEITNHELDPSPPLKGLWAHL